MFMAEIAKEKVKGSMINTDVSNSGSKTDFKNNKITIRNVFLNVSPDAIEKFINIVGTIFKNKSKEDI